MLRTVVRPKVMMQWVKTSSPQQQYVARFQMCFHTLIVEAFVMKSLIWIFILKPCDLVSNKVVCWCTRFFSCSELYRTPFWKWSWENCGVPLKLSSVTGWFRRGILSPWSTPVISVYILGSLRDYWLFWKSDDLSWTWAPQFPPPLFDEDSLALTHLTLCFESSLRTSGGSEILPWLYLERS